MKKRKIILIILIWVSVGLLFGLSSCKKSEPDNNSGDSNLNPDNNLTDTGEFEPAYTSREIADAIMATYTPEELPDTRIDYYFSGVDENSDNYIEPERIGNMINKIFQPIKEFDSVEDFAFYIPSGMSMFEVSVLKIKKGEENNLEILKTLLEKRLTRVTKGDLMDYAPQEIPLYENAKVIIVYNYVILLATNDNGKAEKVINDMINTNKSGNNTSLANTATEPTEIAETTNITNIIEPTDPEPETNKPGSVSMDEVVNIEPEILFDIEQFKTLVKETEEPEQPDAPPPPEQPDDNNDNNDTVSPRRTAVPSVTVKMYSHNTYFLIGGKCEVGAKIRVTGGIDEMFTGSDYGNYLVEVPFNNTGSSTLKLTAELDGKLPSEEITFIVKPQKNITLFEDGGAYGNVIGYNYQYFCADSLDSFVGDDLLNDNEIKALQTRTEKKIQDLRAKGCNTEIIYYLIPNPMRTYAENAPSQYTQNTGVTLRMQWSGAVKAAGATVVDLTDLFDKHKNDEFKIFQKTDTHWSDYGAMLGYYELMNYIGQKFPDALPRPRSDFEVFNKEYNSGDIFSRLYLQPSDLKETTAFVKFNFTPPGGRIDLYQGGNCLNLVHSKVSNSQTTNTNLTGNFPSAYIYRDSFAGTLHDFITDRFSTITFVGMWDYNWRLNDIVDKNPDYIIYIISERNIKAVLYN